MSLAELVDHVIGVDPDRDRITAAVVCARTQGEIASKSFATTARGYGQAMRWAKDHTTDGRRAWSIESTGSYGAGLASALATRGEFVIEFDHPATRPSKDGAKSDSLDAVRAAREILGRKTWATPRSRGAREGLRTLITARDSAKTRAGRCDQRPQGTRRHRAHRPARGVAWPPTDGLGRPLPASASRHRHRSLARSDQTVIAQHREPRPAPHR